jgi:hypothetical protein
MTKIKFFLFFLIASALHNCYAQNNLAKLDSSYSTNFDFTDKEGLPQGYFLYHNNVSLIEGNISGYAVFQYNDGRKFFGIIENNHPSLGISKIYYPNGTIYIGQISVYNEYVPAAIYGNDGCKFLGSVLNYKERHGFLFAADGSYMMGTFNWKKPAPFITSYFDKNNEHIADKYLAENNTAELSFDDYINIEQNTTPDPEYYIGHSIIWMSKKTKFEKNTNQKDIEEIGWSTKKYDVRLGGFCYKKFSLNDTITIQNDFIKGENSLNHEFSKYTLPGYNAYVSSSKYHSVFRSLRNTGTMEFRSGAPKEYTDSYVEYHTNKDGSTYLGEALLGTEIGYGIVYNAKSGDMYFGNTIGGKKNGFGTYKFKDGSYIKGEWKNDERIGFCKSFNAKGELTEEGEYSTDNKVNLQKNVTLGDGYDFVDEFPTNKKETILQTDFVTDKPLTDGAIYTGYIHNNLPEGEGELTEAKGSTYKGKWHNGFGVGVMKVNTTIKIGDKLKNCNYIGTLKGLNFDGFGLLKIDSLQVLGDFLNGNLNGFVKKPMLAVQLNMDII